MIELPEAITIARQMNAVLQGKEIAAGVRGNTPHKFAFYSGSADDYAAILPGKTVGSPRGHGSRIVVPLEPGYLLVLGEGGERILYHASAATLPAKHHLLLQFTDDSYLTVSIQGWGMALLLTDDEAAEHPYLGAQRISALSEDFTLPRYLALFADMEENDPCSVKAFMISKPGLWGVGNGCLQDILFRARIHPRRRVMSLRQEEREALYGATRSVLQQMVDQGGRNSERDLHNQPGAYQRILCAEAVGSPCPVCAALIQKASYLGGSVYFCPSCQK